MEKTERTFYKVKFIQSENHEENFLGFFMTENEARNFCEEQKQHFNTNGKFVIESEDVLYRQFSNKIEESNEQK